MMVLNEPVSKPAPDAAPAAAAQAKPVPPAQAAVAPAIQSTSPTTKGPEAVAPAVSAPPVPGNAVTMSKPPVALIPSPTPAVPATANQRPAMVIPDATMSQARPGTSLQSPSVAQPPRGNVNQPVKSATLVAVMPDGKSALFTDPETRLPKAFKPGEILPSGERIIGIDGRNGRVATDKNVYELE